MKRLLLCVLTLAVAASLVACGSNNVSKGDIEKKTQAFFDDLAQKNGQASFPKITCPKDLEAKKGSSERCVAKGNDGTLGITVTVTEVKDGKASLSFKADDQLTK